MVEKNKQKKAVLALSQKIKNEWFLYVSFLFLFLLKAFTLNSKHSKKERCCCCDQ